MWRMVLMLTVLAALLGCGGGSPEKYLQEGVSHFERQEYDQAIKSYEKVIKLEPRSAVAYNLLGMAYRMKFKQLRDPEMQAQETAAFQKAVELDPNYWVALFNLGATYYFKGEKAKAAPLFKKALALNPNHPEAAQVEKMIAEGEAQKGEAKR